MRFLTILIIFAFVAIGVLGFWYWQGNIYSKETLKLEILAPSELQAGQAFEYAVKLKNNGKTRLEGAGLVFEAPAKSILEGREENRVIQKIEDIYPGEERTYSFQARLFGKENETFEAKALVSYQPKNLKAVYESKTSFTNRISFVPLTLEFDISPKAEAGEEIRFSLNYFSNIDYLLENLRVRAVYPAGFSFVESSPKALEEIEWQIPSLYRASGGRVEIKGEVGGEEGEEKVFRAEIGILKNGEFWPLDEASESVKIVESSLFVSFSINNSQNYIAKAGEMLHYEIFYKNIGKKPVQKKFLIGRLEGDFFDLSSLKSDKGEFGLGDNVILWDWKNVPSLRFLDVGEEGKVEFWARLKDNVDFLVRNPKVDLAVNISGIEKLLETKINSEAALFQKAYFNQEFLENSGPLPPQASKKTEYVILWQIKNSWNELKSVKVRAVLPQTVKPTGKVFPEDAKFTFDSESREVVWSVGEIAAWQSKEDLPLSLAFQVELIPNRSQVGDYAILAGEAEFSAEDVWTGEMLEVFSDSCDTSLPYDETITKEQGRVVE